MFLYNVHTPQKTFALTYKEGESQADLVNRIWAKADLGKQPSTKSGLVYEFEGDRWSLDDDDDLQILLSRFPPSSTPSATLHVSSPHARFGGATTAPSPPAYSTASSILANKPKTRKASGSVKSAPNGSSVSSPSKISQSKSTKTGSQDTSAPSAPTLAAPAAPVKTTLDANGNSTTSGSAAGGLTAPSTKGKAKSILSTRSRKSKWGDDDAEPLGETIKREWTEFHNNSGVRTVLGKVGDQSNVRMLLKSGYRHVYVSRAFAIKLKLVDKKFGMGSSGYTGLKAIGNIPITVGGKTASHPAYISEESHFDVVLGRSWLEKMAVKVDPLDQTVLTYMDSGEQIPCDVVVLKDEKGNVITIT